MTIVAPTPPAALAPGGMNSMCWHGHPTPGVAASSRERIAADDS